MLYNFDTGNLDHARAALLVYAMYKSRDVNSPLNGLETWNRVESFCKGACRKSTTTAEFITKFKESAKIGAIKPRYLTPPSDDNFIVMDDGSLIATKDVRQYQIDILEDNKVRETIEREYPLITMLVRERIQREKYEQEEETENETDID